MSNSSEPLVALPTQPEGVSWPTGQWPRGTPAVADTAAFEALTDSLFELPDGHGVTYALLIVHRGRLVYERYDAGASALYLQYSWSMAKSVTQALVGLLVADGRLDVNAPLTVPEWPQDDPRSAITLDQLLKMRSGLEFREDYVDGQASDVIPMLSFEGRHDTGGFAAAKPLVDPPGSTFSYSSGTTNIICRALGDLVGHGPTGMLAFMRERLFEPIGIRTPTPRFDTAGTFIGSSYLLATPQDFARFGYLYLRDGMWEGNRILPSGWVDYARTPSHSTAEEGYGAHWWLVPGSSRFYASGYDGQRILLAPEQDLMVVRCGRTDADHVPYLWERIDRLLEMFG
jgi:CubicO group peptidase (beta-lactamase class C family)